LLISYLEYTIFKKIKIFAALMINELDQIKLDPKLIIDFVIPPLIFEAMMRIDYKDFMRVKISVLLLATIGVVILYLGITMNIIGVGQNIILIVLVFASVLIGRHYQYIQFFLKILLGKLYSE
jgi:NhaP-type Na+/H+ or K+/H+ antiporter